MPGCLVCLCLTISSHLSFAPRQVTVFFVDYGDTRSLPLAEVRPLRPEHAALAGQAIRCCSSDVGRSGRTTWSEQEVRNPPGWGSIYFIYLFHNLLPIHGHRGYSG